MNEDFTPQQLDKCDIDRLRSYRELLDFYHGQHWEGYPRLGETRLTFNYAKVVIDKITSYLMSGLTFAVDPLTDSATARASAQRAEQALYRVYEANNLAQLDFETEIDCAIMGDGCFKVIWDAEAKGVKVTAPDVQGIYVWWLGDDTSQVWRVASKYKLTAEETVFRYQVKPKGKLATIVELWTARDFELWLDSTLVERKPNPYGFIPFVIYPNLREPKKFWGISDLCQLMLPQRELNRAMSQLSKILELSGNPIAVLENVEESEDIAVRPGAVWNLPEDARAYLLDLLQGGGVSLHIEYINLLYRILHDVSEGWRCVSLKGYKAILLSPWGLKRVLDLRDDVETLRPNDAGDECNWEWGTASCPNHYQNVDEASPDYDATTQYVYNSNYLVDLFNIADSGVGAGTINKITVYAVCKSNVTPNQASIKICVKIGGTIYEGSEQIVTTSYASYSQEWANNPGGGAWNWSDIDALQIGVYARRPHSGFGSTYCTQIYVEVDYSDITAKVSSDTGSGSEAKANGSPLASLGKSESGSAAENPAQEATLADAEAGLGMEAILSLLGKLASDTGAGVEIGYRNILEGAQESSDSGFGAEASSLIAEFEQDEGGEGAEALLTRRLYHTDSGWGDDAVLILHTALTGAETGFGADLLLARLLAVGETGQGGDKLLGRGLSLIDSGSGIEAAAIYKILLATDAGSGLEALNSILALITANEAGYSAEEFGAKIMTSSRTSDMKLPARMGKAGIPHKRVGL